MQLTSYEKSLRVGSFALVCSLLLRLGAQGYLGRAARFLGPQLKDLLTYSGTGQAVRSSSSEPAYDFAEESPPPAQTEGAETTPAQPLPTQTEAPPDPLIFTDADTVSIYNTSGLDADPMALLQTETALPDLEGPKVLLYSTHATESYTKAGEAYQETAAYRTLDPGYNVLSLGKALKEALESQGIEVLRDETLHDYPSYNAAYSHSRMAAKQYLEDFPSLALVLDLHRDAADTPSGQLRPLTQVEGTQTAQIMLVVGTNARGLRHPDWEQNLALALKLQALLERISPGITRPTCLRPQRFNQDLSRGCLLIEIGGAGNTHEEALAAIPPLAQAIGMLLTARG